MSKKSKLTNLEKSESHVTAKRNAAERRREKAQAIANKFKGGNEPQTNPMEYQLSLVKAFNWYNINVELKQIRGYLNDYLIETNRKKLIPVLNQVSDFDIKSIGVLCRLKLRGEYLEPNHADLIESKIISIASEVQPVVKVEPKVKVDTTPEQAILHSEAFEEAIDEFVKKKKTDFVPLDYLKSKEIAASVSKKIGEYYSTMLSELQSIDTDKELAEGYSNFTKTQMKKFISFVESIVNACNQQVVSSKVRKPRKTKPVSPTKLVAKVKYMKEFADLNLKSIKPESMIDSSEIWVYNTKYRKLAVYKSEKGNKLSIKGTTVIGFDIKESQQVMLRKPDEFFKNTQLAKRALATGLKGIKTRPVTPNGRINEETILLGAF